MVSRCSFKARSTRGRGKPGQCANSHNSCSMAAAGLVAARVFTPSFPICPTSPIIFSLMPALWNRRVTIFYGSGSDF